MGTDCVLGWCLHHSAATAPERTKEIGNWCCIKGQCFPRKWSPYYTVTSRCRASSMMGIKPADLFHHCKHRASINIFLFRRKLRLDYPAETIILREIGRDENLGGIIMATKPRDHRPESRTQAEKLYLIDTLNIHGIPQEMSAACLIIFNMTNLNWTWSSLSESW